ncbi:right-handed parallel beta-helix repeat-containing protein [Zavarzinella formosa]|uniref:right-handed parallel beta-helix repeat-containing protein n=1 Tax=Zavarzinella formosa TaxID=360055 RepID=UPI0002F7E8BB|nr:right-handed parallel beta-helix repeat-containing protein [Zavarzinella formosa]
MPRIIRSWSIRQINKSRMTRKPASARLNIQTLEDRSVPAVTWQVQSDYFGTRDGVSQARSLRGIALSEDGTSVYGGFIQGTTSWGVREVNAGVLAVPGTDTAIFGNTGNAPYGTNPEYKGGSSGTFEAWLPTGANSQPKGVATDERGQVYVTNIGSKSVTIYNSDLTAQIGTISTGAVDPANVTAQKIGNTYYAYVATGTGVVSRWNVNNPISPVLDTSWGVGGQVNLHTQAPWLSATINGLEVDRDGTIFIAGKLSTAPGTQGNTVFKVPADGNLANAISTTVPGALDVALFGDKVYATKYAGNTSAIAVLNKSDLSSGGADLLTNIARNNTDTDNGYSGIDVSYDGRLYVADQLYNITTAASTYTPPATSFNPTPVGITNTRVNFDRILVSSPVDTPATVYVDDDWAGLTNGTEVDSDPLTVGVQPAVIGYDAFPKIQSGVNAAESGGTVKVLPGNYKENITINKPLTLLGANAGTAGADSRGAESIITTNGNQTSVVTLASAGVTVDGFTIDGDDPSVVGGPLTSGDDTNVSYGVRPTAAFSNETVQNNIIKHVYIGFRGDGAASGNTISKNWFDSIGVYDFGYAVSLRSNYYADVTGNKMTRVWTGVHLSNFSQAGPATWSVSGNDISSYAGGILDWLSYSNATGVTIDGNKISAATGAVTNNVGVMFESVQDGVKPTFTNNTITGTDNGVVLFNVPTTNTITLGSTNSVVDARQTGVLFTDNLNFNPVGTTNFLSGGPGGASKVIIDGMPISTIAGGTGIKVDATLGTATNLTVMGAPAISGGDTGLELIGSLAGLTGNTLGGVSFSGQTGPYVELSNGAEHGVALDGTGVTYDGVLGSAVTTSQGYAVEDKITHAVDDSTLGFVRVKPGQVFVTMGSATGGGGITRGIAVASAGDQVNVDAGTYDDDVNMVGGAKPGLKLIGSGAANTTIKGVLGGANETVVIGQDQVLDGFTITRATGSGENNIGVANDSGSTGAVVRNNVITGNRTGVYLNGSNSQATFTRNVIDDNRTGFLLPDGTGYGDYQITQNDVTNNKTFGFQFAAPTALGAGFTISGNNITGNFASQLENNTGSVLNASANWFGSAQPVVTLAKLNGTLPSVFDYPGPASQPDSPYPYTLTGDSAAQIDYSPTLNVGTDTDSLTPGFQGDFSLLNVFTAGAQSGPDSRIQEGIDLAATGGTVAVQTGQYGGFDGTGKTFTLSPEGVVAVNGPVKLADGNTLKVNLTGTTPGTDYAQLAVTGTVDVTGAALNLSVAPAFTPPLNTTFDIIDNDDTDAVTGTFATLAEGSKIVVGTRSYAVSYGTTDNDVSLKVASLSLNPPVNAIPAPQEMLEDQTLKFSTANDNEFTLSTDPNFIGDLKVKLSVSHGTLTLGSTDDVMFSQGTGTDDEIVEITGTVTAINTALEGLVYTPDADYFGGEEIVVVTNDLNATGNGPIITQDTAIVTVDPVDDVPSFTAGPNQEVDEDSGAQTVTPWAEDISKGPANESSQTVSFEIFSNSNPALFSAGPVIGPDGTLTYTSAPNANGTATIQVRIKDSGTTDNGGVDTSATQTFTITVDPQNDAPSDISLANSSVPENSPAGTTVGTFSTTDLDGDNAFTYTLVQSGTYPDNNSFTIDGSTLKTTASFDYETKNIYTIRVNSEDAGGLSTEKVFTITVAPVNEQPTIDITPTLMLPDVAKNALNPSGIQVAGLVVNATDSETPTTVGVAITGLHGTGGKWQSSPNGSAGSWVTLPAVSSSGVLLLSRNSFIRFLPNKNFVGFSGISYRAWDGQIGTTNTIVNPATNPVAFSTATDTAWVQVGVTVPDVDVAGRAVLPKTTEDNLNPLSKTSKSIVGFLGVDYPANANLGLAVTATTGDGTWQVKVGTKWQPIDGVSDTTAYLLKGTDSIRFLPNANWYGNATITYRAWSVLQGSGGVDPKRGNVTTGSQFSVESETAVVQVTPVNDAPVLDLSVARIFTSSPRSVADLNATGASDVDTVLGPTPVNTSVVDNTNLGIAITKITQKGGFWEYSKTPANPLTWVKIPTNISTVRALLLNGAAEIRFDAGASSVASGQFQYKAWDGSSGGVSGTFKSTAGTAFSKGIETATYSLGNQTPTFKPGAATNFPSTKENEFPKDIFAQKVISAGGRRFLQPQIMQETKLSGQPVSILLGLFSDADTAALKGIAIYGSDETMTTNGGGTAQGTWEYMIDGKTWQPVGSVSAGSKLLLRSTDRLRFVPAENAYGTVSLSYNAWDQKAGVAGDRLDVSNDSVSSASLTSKWTVIQTPI